MPCPALLSTVPIDEDPEQEEADSDCGVNPSLSISRPRNRGSLRSVVGGGGKDIVPVTTLRSALQVTLPPLSPPSLASQRGPLVVSPACKMDDVTLVRSRK